MIKHNGKQVYQFCNRHSFFENMNIDDCWHDMIGWRSRNNTVLVFDSIENINKLIRQKCGTITDKSILYFNTNSKFPRFKLKDSGVKRCIKMEKANQIVVGEFSPTFYGHSFRVLEDSEYYYILDGYNYNYYLTYARDPIVKQRVTDFINDPIKFFNDNHLIYGSNLKEVYKGEVTFFDERIDGYIEDIINGTNIDLITDNQLDEFINKSYDSITYDDYKSIDDMMSSEDHTIAGLGLKTLIGFNVQKTPCAISLLIGKHQNISYLPEWNHVGVRQMLKSINWTDYKFYKFPNLYKVLHTDDIDNLNDVDKSLCREIIVYNIRKYIDESFNEELGPNLLKFFNINITYNVE